MSLLPGNKSSILLDISFRFSNELVGKVGNVANVGVIGRGNELVTAFFWKRHPTKNSHIFRYILSDGLVVEWLAHRFSGSRLL